MLQIIAIIGATAVVLWLWEKADSASAKKAKEDREKLVVLMNELCLRVYAATTYQEYDAALREVAMVAMSTPYSAEDLMWASYRRVFDETVEMRNSRCKF